MNASSVTPKALLAAAMLIGAVVGGFGASGILQMRADALSGETAIGRVVSFEVTKPTTGGGWSRYPVVEFTTKAGERIKAQARTSSDAKIGTSVRVLYYPSQPGRPQLPDETAYWLVPWSSACVGAFGLLFGLLLWRRDGRPFGAG
jgi:Protein of unknown function (DUF3592)